MRKPPPSPILWGLLTPLQKRAPIAASTALPFLGFQDGWVDAFYQKSYLARMSRPTLAQGFESTDTAPCKKRPSLKKKTLVFISPTSGQCKQPCLLPEGAGSVRGRGCGSGEEEGDPSSSSCVPEQYSIKKYPKHSVSRKSHLIYTNVRNHFQTNQNLGAF